MGQFFGTCQKRACVFTLSLGHADGFGVGIAFGAHTIRFDLRNLALLFELSIGSHIEGEPTPRQVGGYRCGIGAKLFGIEHS